MCNQSLRKRHHDATQPRHQPTYTDRMQSPCIHYVGTFRYRDQATLASALARATDDLDDDDLTSDHDLVSALVTRGNRLVIDVKLGSESQGRYAAANLLLRLAHGADEGAVAATNQGKRVDLFVAGDED